MVDGGASDSANSVTPRNLVQTNLVVGPTGDRHEREADRIARDVMAHLPRSSDAQDETARDGAPMLSRPESVSRATAAAGGEGALDANLEASIKGAHGGGVRIAQPMRGTMERAFGADFGDVRVHTGPRANELNTQLRSRAFTTGSNIFVADGTYPVTDRPGLRLLAHELTHVVQQGKADVVSHGSKNEAQRHSGRSMRLQRQAMAEAPEVDEPAEERYKPSKADEQEYELLPKNIKTAAAGSIKTLDSYIAYRHAYFGSAANYESAKAAADAEFDAIEKAWVWQRIGQDESKAAKRVLYRWVRKAYLDKGVTDPIAMIKAGKTADLKSKLTSVEAEHPTLKTGGFVARPIKLKGYRLGTVSKHGLGKAVDVRPQSRNPQLKKKEWHFILAMTGMSVNRSNALWKSDPAALWQGIHDLDVAYVAELKVRIAAKKAERVKAGKSADKPPAFEAVLAGHPTLIKTARKHGVEHGFFDLGKDVVVSFANQGFKWGATFGGNVDLHHFEVP